MKKILFLSACLVTLIAQGQTEDRPWAYGVHGGLTHYRGDLGNGFYDRFQPYYAHAGFSLSRYLTPRLDATLFLHRGAAGYFGAWNPDPFIRTNFLVHMNAAHLWLKYNLASPSRIVRPYVFAGASAIQQEGVGDSYIMRRKYDYAPEAGLGINIRIFKWMSFQLQETFAYTSADDVDFTVGGGNDMYLYHTAGLIFTPGKIGKIGDNEPEGVGDKIDQCPKVSNGIGKKKKNQKTTRKAWGKKSGK